LSVGEQQRVEILKALYREARILILDEPTAVLTPMETEALFATLNKLVAAGSIGDLHLAQAGRSAVGPTVWWCCAAASSQVSG
jgi:ABC-type branched-subunit amino acid transport system ATPase component